MDISNPAEVAKVLQEEGYKATLKTNDRGEPYIVSAANGSNFTVEFFSCEGVSKCGSAQFYAWYKKNPAYTIEFTNEWNKGKRFVKAAIDKDGDLSTYMDFTLLGKSTYANFADVIDWWSVMTGELHRVMDAARQAK